MRALALFRQKCIRASDDHSGGIVGVCLVRDTDDEARRRDGFERARSQDDWPFEVVLGLPHTKRECWILAAFTPKNEDEEEALDELKSRLGFDPTRKAEELTAQSSGAKRDAKRVLAELTDGDVEREYDALEQIRIDELRSNGREVGLADFIEEVERRIGAQLDDSRSE